MAREPRELAVGGVVLGQMHREHDITSSDGAVSGASGPGLARFADPVPESRYTSIDEWREVSGAGRLAAAIARGLAPDADGDERRREVITSILTTGDVVPDLTLPLLDGGSLSLRELRGRRALLFFWDPGEAAASSCRVAAFLRRAP